MGLIGVVYHFLNCVSLSVAQSDYVIFSSLDNSEHFGLHDYYLGVFWRLLSLLVPNLYLS